MNKTIAPLTFLCDFCGRSISGTMVIMDDDKYFHEECAVKLKIKKLLDEAKNETNINKKVDAILKMIEIWITEE